jgi:hypothetical protein
VNARPQVEHIAAAVTKIAENGGSTALSAADPPQTVIMGVASHRAGTPDELEARLGGECLELEVAHDHEVDVARALAGSLITIRRTPTCCSARCPARSCASWCSRAGSAAEEGTRGF